MSRVVVVGSVNMDLVVTAGTLPRPGETVLGDSFTAVPGGKGANQAIAVAKAGGECDFIGAVGDDAFGVELRANLVDNGVGVERLRTAKGPSGVALIAVDAKAENLIVVAPGANASLSRLDAQDRSLIQSAEVLLCQLEIPLTTVVQAAEAARSAGRTVVLNAAPARVLPAELLAEVDLLVVNQSEAEAIAGRPGTPDDLLQALTKLVPRAVITLGKVGCAYADRSGKRHVVAAPQVEAVDTTAAGDAFTGALAVVWARRWPIVEALRWACAAGAVCATKRGATLPTAEEIDEMYRKSS